MAEPRTQADAVTSVCCGRVPGSFKDRPIGNACQLCHEPPAAEVEKHHARTGHWLPHR